MLEPYWHKQTNDQPLFPDIAWSQPQNKRLAGKLLIIGGQSQSFASPANAFTAAVQAGIGTVKVLLPDSTQKILGRTFSEAEFAPSTPSGSFNRQSLDHFLELAKWSDGVLLAGDFGHNSETAILLENFMAKYQGLVTMVGDSLDYFMVKDSPLLYRQQTLSVIDVAQLQKLGKFSGSSKPVLHKMSLHELVEVLHDWTTGPAGGLITFHAEHTVFGLEGQVSTTPSKESVEWQQKIAAYSSVWWLQQPQKLFEAVTTAISVSLQ